MKKLLTFLVALVIVLSLSLPISAAEPETYRAVYLGGNNFFVESPTYSPRFNSIPPPVSTYEISPNISFNPGEMYDISIDNDIIVNAEISAATIVGNVSMIYSSAANVYAFAVDGTNFVFSLTGMGTGFPGIIPGMPSFIRIIVHGESAVAENAWSSRFRIGDKMKIFLAPIETRGIAMVYIIEETPLLKTETHLVESAKLGKTALASFSVTNTGDIAENACISVEGVKVTLLQDMYIVDPGDTVTVPVYVDITYDVLAKAKNGEYLSFIVTPETDSYSANSVSILLEDLINYDYQISLSTSLSATGILSVSIILNGSINYTQVAAELAYDADSLRYIGYTYLHGWVAAVDATKPNILSLRSMPTMNMTAGVSCEGGIRIATLQFAIKGNNFINAIDNLRFTSLTVFPAGSLREATTAPSAPFIR